MFEVMLFDLRKIKAYAQLNHVIKTINYTVESSQMNVVYSPFYLI